MEEVTEQRPMNNEYVNSRISKLSPVTLAGIFRLYSKGPVKLIQGVKITNSFVQSLSNLFHFIVLTLQLPKGGWSSRPPKGFPP